MLQIRTEQIITFKQAIAVGFRAELIERMRAFAPNFFKVLGDEGLTRMVDLGMVKAEEAGFTKKATIQFYLEAMVVLGSHFDTDPQYPWAARILQARDPADEIRRADLLFDAVRSYRKLAFGPEYLYEDQAVRRFLMKDEEECLALNSTARIISELEQTYPEKAAKVGRQAMHNLLEAAERANQELKLDMKGMLCATASLMFAFGHGVFRDPLFPWASAIFKRELPPESYPAELFGRMKTYLNASLGQGI